MNQPSPTRPIAKAVAMCAALLCVLQVHSAIPATERSALIDFYNSTNGGSWTESTGWMGVPGTECSWAGVTCNAAGTTVVELGRSGKGLSGTLPASLIQLTNLQFLTLDSNRITGSTPAFVGMNSLQLVNLNRNLLDGTLGSFSALPSLQDFLASSNRLTGSIPALNSLPRLRELRLSNNRLSGTIPSLSSLAALTNLYLNNNALTGSVPTLTGLSNLTDVGLQHNRLSGTLPSLASVSNLNGFSVRNNQITGVPPDPPATHSLAANNSELCPNPMTPTTSSVWDVATGRSPWSAECTSSFVVTPVPAADGAIFPDWPQLAGSIDPGASFEIIPNAGYGLIMRGTCPRGSFVGTNYNTNSMTADCTVTPEFSNAMFTVNVNSTSGGTVSPLGAQMVRFGSQLTVTTVADVGFRRSAVTSNCGGNGHSGGATGPITTFQVDANCAVNITFAPLAVNVTATAVVSVPSGGIAGGVVSPASRTVAQGQSTTFALIPDVGYRSSSASGCGATLTGNIATTGALTVNCAINVAFAKTCALDVNTNSSTTAATDGALILRYLLGFRGTALVDGIAGVNPANAGAIATYIADHLYRGVEPSGPTAAVTGLILYRLMSGVSDTALLTGIQRPAGSPLPTAAAIRADVNAQCITNF